MCRSEGTLSMAGSCPSLPSGPSTHLGVFCFAADLIPGLSSAPGAMGGPVPAGELSSRSPPCNGSSLSPQSGLAEPSSPHHTLLPLPGAELWRPRGLPQQTLPGGPCLHGWPLPPRPRQVFLDCTCHSTGHSQCRGKHPVPQPAGTTVMHLGGKPALTHAQVPRHPMAVPSGPHCCLNQAQPS